ncbi:MAG: rhodanese-like domain-containing protein [Desulfobacterales bacterium]
MEQLLRDMTLEFFGSGKHKISPDDLLEIKNILLLDVRTKEEDESISITFGNHPNIDCRNIPLNELPDRIDEIPEDKLIAIFCPANSRSGMAYLYLLSKGFINVRILEGGYTALTDAVKPGKVLKIIQKKK